MNVSPSLASLRSRLVVFAALLCLSSTTRAFAQSASADYTTDLPSVQKIETQLQGTDPIDTAARQVAVLEYLQTYIQRIRDARQYNGPYTPGELQHRTDYAQAQYDLTQGFTKTHTADELKTFQQKEGNYSLNNALDWIKQLEGTQAAAAYGGAESSLAATQQAHVAQEQQQYQQDVAAQSAGDSGMSSDPTSIAARRCLELGGTNTACLGSSLMGGIISTFTGGAGLGALTGPGRAGVILSGNYGPSTGSGPSVTFSGDSASINNCGKLVPASLGYTLSKTAASLQVALANASSPLILTMRPDGSLNGPGLISMTGQIITGYQTVTSTQMINGARAAANQCNGPCQTVSQIPVYAPATDRCTISALAAPPPPPPPSSSGADASPMGGLLGGLMSAVATVAPASLPGLRMEGKYFSSGGLILDFAGDAVTMDCGQAHIKAPYTVLNNPSSLTVQVQNSGGPFTLVVSSSNTLQGSGSTTVNGRLVSGMNGDNVTFVAHSESCPVATLAPQSSGSSISVATNASPAPASAPAPVPASSAPMLASAAAPTATAAAPAAASSAGSMTLAIASSFPIAKNPLAGAIVKLMTARFDDALRKAGAPVPDGTTPGHALQAYVSSCPPPTGCPAAAALLKPYYVGTATFDSNGKATLSAPVAAGNYYILCAAQGTSGALVWDMPVTLKAGAGNTITLTALNAELVK